MSAPRLIRLGALAIMALLLATCRDSTGNDRAQSGWLSLRLTTPNTDDGGILLTISGARIDSVRTAHPQLLSRRSSESSIDVVIGGNLSAGVIAEIRVPDTRNTAQYSASIREIAARTTYQQRNATGYTVSVGAPLR